MEELFTAALEGMAEIMMGEGAGRDDINSAAAGKAGARKEIKVSSADETALLIDFLSEVLTISQIEKIVFLSVRFRRLTSKTVKAEVSGIRGQNFAEDIKAVTYHEAEIRKNTRGNFETTIVFDI